MEVTENDQVLTLAQAAELLGVTRATLAQQAKKGVLRATLAGSVYLVTAKEVERYRREIRGKTGFAAASHPLHGKRGGGGRRKKDA
jgi:excisionase family DNA binding protein